MIQVSRYKIQNMRGQLLVEAVLAIALLGILAGIIGMAVNVSTQSNKASGKKTVAVALAQEAIEAVRAIRDNNKTTGRGWNRIYLPPDGSGDKDASKGDGNLYYIGQSANEWILSTDTANRDIVKDGVTYDRSVVIKNVCRDAKNGGGDIAATGACNETTNWVDPSTQYVRVTVTAGGISAIIVEEYLTRAKNEVKVWDTQGEFTGGTCSSTKVTGTGEVELGSGGC